MKTLAEAGERHVIERFRRLLSSGDSVVAGIGDDCAVVRSDSDGRFDWVLTSDPVVEGVHFTTETAPSSVGRKAIARILSDLAAMGAEPLWALLDIVAPPDTPLPRIEAVCGGASKMADKYGLIIVGGDTAEGPVLELHAFGVGRVPRGTAILRSGAKPGEIIYVTGSLGLSAAGKHLEFEPRVNQGIWLREGVCATSLIDISDGMASDLHRLTDMSGTGAVIRADDIPISEAAQRANDGRSPLDHALYDGEDYELLFTVPFGKKTSFETLWAAAFKLPVTPVGVITDRRGTVQCVTPEGHNIELADAGYEHFR